MASDGQSEFESGVFWRNNSICRVFGLKGERDLLKVEVKVVFDIYASFTCFSQTCVRARTLPSILDVGELRENVLRWNLPPMHNINYCHFNVSVHCSAHVIRLVLAARHYPIGTDGVLVAQVHATSFAVLIKLSFSVGKKDGLLDSMRNLSTNCWSRSC